jgi:uncharacterized protein with WD repeat
MASFADIAPAAEPEAAPTPPTKLLLKSRAGLELLNGPPSNPGDADLSSSLNADASFPRTSADMTEWSKDGSLLAVATAAGFSVRSGDTGAVVFESAVPVKAMHFSPRGRYLLTWQNPRKAVEGEGRAPGNLVVWEIATGAEVLRLTQKLLRWAHWPSLQWSDDEVVAMRATSDEIQVCNLLCSVQYLHSVSSKLRTQSFAAAANTRGTPRPLHKLCDARTQPSSGP